MLDRVSSHINDHICCNNITNFSRLSTRVILHNNIRRNNETFMLHALLKTLKLSCIIHRCSDLMTRNFKKVISDRSANKHMICDLKKFFKKWHLRRDLCPTKDKEERMFRIKCNRKMLDLFSKKHSRIMRKKFCNTNN